MIALSKIVVSSSPCKLLAACLPITILIDVTSALYKNLKLDEEIKQWVAQNNISIICHESYQKFGLAHTDQVQAGTVYGLCHKDSFTPIVINQFNENARYDFDNNLDMISLTL